MKNKEFKLNHFLSPRMAATLFAMVWSPTFEAMLFTAVCHLPSSFRAYGLGAITFFVFTSTAFTTLFLSYTLVLV